MCVACDQFDQILPVLHLSPPCDIPKIPLYNPYAFSNIKMNGKDKINLNYAIKGRKGP
jgi:hypothetical protein